MNSRLHFLLFFLGSILIGFLPTAHAQIAIDAYITPPSGSGPLTATCTADLENSAYEGVSTKCTLYTPNNGEKSCSDGGDGDTSAECTNTVDSPPAGQYQVQGQYYVYYVYDDGCGSSCGDDDDDDDDDDDAISVSPATGSGLCGAGTDDPNDPYDDPLGYDAKGTVDCGAVGSCTLYGENDGLYYCDSVSSTEFGEVQSPVYDYNPQISVSIDPSSATLNQGQSKPFTATVQNGNSADVTWKISPATGAGSLSASTGETVTYSAPASVTQENDSIVITATSQQDTSASGTATVTLLPVTFTSVTADPSTFVASTGNTSTLTATADGYSGTPPFTWTTGNTGSTCLSLLKLQGTFSSNTGTTVTYIPPSGVTTQCTDVVMVTDPTGTPAPTSTVTLTLIPPVTVNSITTPWYAGQTMSVVIAGSGFGTAPSVTLSPPIAAFTITGTPTNTQITGTISIPATIPAEAVTVSVTDTTAGITVPAGSGQVTVVGATFTMTLTPTGVQLDESQTQQFTATLACKTGVGGACTVSPATTWSINPPWGSISSSGLYTASVKGIAQNTPVTVTACATPVNTAICGTDQLTILPINVGNINSPSSPVLAGKTFQFNPPTVSNAPGNTTTVYWYVNGIQSGNTSVGTITTAGLYTAPNPVTTTNTSVTVTACSTVDTSRCAPNPATVQLADFTVAASPNSQGVTPGNKVTYTVTVAAIGQFTGTVALTSTGCPTGATCSFSPASITSFPGTSTYTVSTVSTTPDGIDPLTITGTTSGSSGTLARNYAVSLAVGTPSFSLTATPASQTVNPGSSTTYTATIAPIVGFTGTVALSVAGCPSNVTCSFNPTSVSGGSGTSTLTAATTSSAAPGTYTLTITGTSGTLTQSQTVTLVIAAPGFTCSVTPASLNVAPNGSGSYTVTCTSTGGFTGTIALVANGLPGGVSGIFSPASISNGAGKSTLTVTVSASVPQTTYPLTIACTSGTLSQNLPVSLVVSQLGDFSLNASPGSETVALGSSGTVTMIVSPINGFTGNVALTATGQPTGLTATLNPTTVIGGSGNSTLTLTASASMTAGTYLVTITGTSGTDTHSITITVIVPVGVTVSPATVTLTAGQTQQFTATVTGTTTKTVAWTAGSGTVSSTGLYTAPKPVLSATDWVEACSTVSPTSCATATVNLPLVAGIDVQLTTDPEYVLCSYVNVCVPQVAQGQTATGIYDVYVAAIDGFTGTVSLSVSGLPAGVTASFNPASVAVNSTSIMSFSATNSVAVGNYSFSVTGTSGSTTQTVASSVPLSVVYPVTLSPANPTLSPGQTQQFTATVGNLANQSVTWSVWPSGINSSGLYTAPTTVWSQETAYPIACSTVSPTSCGWTTAVTNPQPSFLLGGPSGSPSIILPLGTSGSISVSVSTGDGFSGTVALTVSGLPAGVTATLNPTSLGSAGGTSTLTVSASSQAAIGNSTITVTGTSGSLTSSAPIALQTETAPQITGLSPASGAVGTQVQLEGIPFSATNFYGDTVTVAFNGVAASFAESCVLYVDCGSSPGMVVVPSGLPTGVTSVVVTVNGVSSNTAVFTVALPTTPTIYSVTPASAAAGTPLTIGGGDFGTSQGQGQVLIGGCLAPIQSWSQQQIVALMPGVSGNYNGTVSGGVVVDTGGQQSNAGSATILPSLIGISPASGAVGTSVNLLGSGLVDETHQQGLPRTYTYLPSISFYNDIAAKATTSQTVTQCLEQSVTTTVPTGATTGNVTATTAQGTSNTVPFTVP